MKIFKMHILLLMIVLALIFATIRFISLPWDNEIQLISYLVSTVLLTLNLIAIVSYIVIIVVFKDITVSQTIKYTSIAVTGILVAVTITIFVAPSSLLRSEGQIKKSILKVTPIGMNMEDVFDVIDKKKWAVERSSPEKWEPTPQYLKDWAVERKKIDACIGEYTIIFVTSVVVIWYFDDDLKLIDLEVREYHDSI